MISLAKAGDAAETAGMCRTVKICSAAPPMRRSSGSTAHWFWPTCPCGRSRRLAGEKTTRACISSANPRLARRGTTAACARVRGRTHETILHFVRPDVSGTCCIHRLRLACAVPETEFMPFAFLWYSGRRRGGGHCESKKIIKHEDASTAASQELSHLSSTTAASGLTSKFGTGLGRTLTLWPAWHRVPYPHY